MLDNINMIRLLRADEIECRVAAISEKGLSLLLYKDARVDQKILDETFGTFGWQRSHQCIDGNLYCTVSIYDRETGTWVSKQDVGTMGYTEKEKSQASDSFKRACFNWGIGRELYTAPHIWVSASNVHIQKKDDRYFTYDRFTVQDISYNDNREIVGLTVLNKDGKEVYTLNAKNSTNTTDSSKQEQELKSGQSSKQEQTHQELKSEQMEAISKELARTGVALEMVLKRYGITDINEMSQDTYKKAINSLKKTKSAKPAA